MIQKKAEMDKQLIGKKEFVFNTNVTEIQAINARNIIYNCSLHRNENKGS